MSDSDIFFRAGLAQTTDSPIGVEIVRAEGVWLETADGRRLMDMISGVGVSALGHGHPKIKAAISEQLNRHLHVMVYGEFIQEAQSRAAAALTSILPAALDTVYFVNSGTEANEAALKLAKRATGRSKIISFKGAYHGSTHGSLSVSGNETKKEAFKPLLPEVEFIELNRLEDLARIDNLTACVILETVQGDAGVRIPEVPFMRALRKKCNESGALLILDEIQCGLGRTGRMFAFEHFDIIPDMLTLGKALGGGMPIGALIAGRNLMRLFTHNPMLGHITTFGGHPLICAAAAAGLDILTTEVSLERIESKGRSMAGRIRQLPNVKEVRQIGYFFAIEMDGPDRVRHVVERCMERGLIGFWFLSCPWAFRIAPPLNISDDEIELALEIIEWAALQSQ
jgi:acetylornithine/succinyldiaminopimelate/putrescine aminotransferase